MLRLRLNGWAVTSNCIDGSVSFEFPFQQFCTADEAQQFGVTWLPEVDGISLQPEPDSYTEHNEALLLFTEEYLLVTI